jgi:hypothetical protein
MLRSLENVTVPLALRMMSCLYALPARVIIILHVCCGEGGRDQSALALLCTRGGLNQLGC